MFKRTENYLQDASRFHNVGVGKSSMYLSNINENTYHKGYGSGLYASPKLPRDIGAINSPYNEGVKMKSHRNTRPIDRYSNTLTKDTQSRFYHNQPELSAKNRYAKRDNVNPLVGTENLGDIRINRIINNFKSSSTGHLKDL